jgi:Deoxyhypusine synthase
VPFPYEEFDLSGVMTYPLASRPSKAHAEDFARPFVKGGGFKDWLDRLPNVLAAQDLKAVVSRILRAKQSGGGIIWGFGAHVIKTGLSPILIDLMRRGFVSALATNGAGVIHDFEVAIGGATSEDVDETLGPGRFGMAEETGRILNDAIAQGVKGGQGLGQAVGRYLRGLSPAHMSLSIAAAASELDIPLTVHVAIGTDIIHMHPAASGSALGEGSLRDFRYFVSNVARLERGVFLNCGSAVILPEVFLKAVALARNHGRPLTDLTTVNLDFARLYRPQVNVVTRPTKDVGAGYSLTGHHELLIPLLAAALIEGD